MSKLFNLREWLTIDEASKHLSLMLGEDVTEADLYRLALDGHLLMSVNFVNKTHGKLGRIVGLEGVEYFEMPADLFRKSDITDEVKMLTIMKSLRIDDEHFMNFDKEIKSIGGVWDLMMLGGDMLDIEHYYQQLTGGPEVTLVDLEGVFVRKNDVICHLMESFDENEYQRGSKAAEKKIEEFIIKDNISIEDAKLIRDQYELDRKIYLNKRKISPKENDYYPCGGLPSEGVLVIRTSSILGFLKTVEQPSPSVNKNVSTKERYTFLVMIASLCKEAEIDITKKGMAAVIAKVTENIGAPISEDTIRPLLKQMNDALEARRH